MTSKPSDIRFTARTVWLCWLLIASSIGLRFVRLDAPILEWHSFRQTHNGIVIRNLAYEKFSWTDYETPIFGPPWKLPIEFPIYHATAAALLYAGIPTVDMAARLTTIFYFLAVCALFYRFCTRFFPGKSIPLLSLLIYVWSPMNYVWSRAAFIDHASIFFGLAYFLAFYNFLTTRRWRYVPVAFTLGCLGYLAKSITMLVFDVPLAIFLIQRLRIELRSFRSTTKLGPRLPFALTVLSLILIPFVVGWLWVKHVDAIKAASVFTQPHTSASLREWYFGTLANRFSLSKWGTILARIPYSSFPLAWTALVIWGLKLGLRGLPCQRRLVWGTILALQLPILIFFSGFWHHDYYILPWLVFAAPFAALALANLIELARQRWDLPRSRKRAALVTAFLLVSYAPCAIWYTRYTIRFDRNYYLCRVGDRVRELTPPSEYVIVGDFDYHTEILHYAERKGFMLEKPEYEGEMTRSLFRTEPFTTVVVKKPSGHDRLFANWRSSKLVDTISDHDDTFYIYKVADPLSPND